MKEQKNRPQAARAESTHQQQGQSDTGGNDVGAGNDTDLAAALEAAEKKADENWSEFLRARAELDNLHKRSARELQNAHKYALESFIKELLPVKDSLEQGLQAAKDKPETDTVEQLVEGKELTLKMLSKVLAEHGIEEIDPQGEPFDPERHEAMTTQPSIDQEPDTVVLVLQKGYILNGRLMRPARVVVAKPAA